MRIVFKSVLFGIAFALASSTLATTIPATSNKSLTAVTTITKSQSYQCLMQFKQCRSACKRPNIISCLSKCQSAHTMCIAGSRTLPDKGQQQQGKQ